ncbi:hypothetical protein ODU82_00480 [Lactobacillus amylovorus]|uniref:hypothetical protein n=1 Tax=Lactobacillus amylovorus TaxID=1604 RepID=UPI00232C279D|nr:hypothetical protein [Lactobacillus amylovorus]MDB6267225.1 hypothetical protein [Lactobacillus amylovorus]
MKPNTRILDYTTLVQDGVLTLDDVPQDIKAQVTKWVRYLSGVTDNGMVKDDTATKLATTVENKLSATLDNAAKTGLVVGEKDGE